MTGKIVVAALLGLSLAAAGCGDSMECAPGTRQDGTRCVPLCGAEQVWDEASGTCVAAAKCGLGTHLDEATSRCVLDNCVRGTHFDEANGHCVPDACALGTHLDDQSGVCVPDACAADSHRDALTGICVPDSAGCQSHQVWDPESASCVELSDYCSNGTTWVASERRCVQNDELLVADHVESGTSTFLDPDSFTLPAENGSVVLGGVIAPEVIEGQGIAPDRDFWTFETSGPTLLRIAVDGVGGTRGAFAVTSRSEGYERLAIGTVGDAATREVFLPRAGTWQIVVCDAAALINPRPVYGEGVVFGGPSAGYFATVSHLPIPEPTALNLVDGQASIEGVWSASAPLSFYSVASTGLGLFQVGLESESESEVEPKAAFPRSGLFAWVSSGGGDYLEYWKGNALAAAGNLILAVDRNELTVSRSPGGDYRAVSFPLSFEDVDYRLAVARLPATELTGTVNLSVEQPAWTSADGSSRPYSYLVFSATRGDVVSIKFTAGSSGSGAARLFDAMMREPMAEFASFGSSPATLEILAPYTGAYIVQTWGNAAEAPEGIPALTYDPTITLLKQPSVALGALTSEYLAVSQQIANPDLPMALYSFTPAVPGQFFEIEATSTTPAFTPAVMVIDGSSMQPVAGALGSVFGRFGDRELYIMVYDAERGLGAFDLRVTPMVPEDLGSLGTAGIAANAQFAPGEAHRVYEFHASAFGEATLTVAPTTANVLVRFYNANGRMIREVNEVEAGSEVVDLAVAPEEAVVFSIDVVGEPLAAAETVGLTLSLQSIPSEVEPNDARATATPIAIGSPLAGQISPRTDVDMYALTLSGPAQVGMATSRAGAEIDTLMELLAPDGSQLAANDDTDGSYSQISFSFAEAGTYFVKVTSYGSSEVGSYLLTVSAAQ